MLSWDKTYSVFIPELDKHHQYLLSLMNALCEDVRGKRYRELIAKHFDSLLDYADKHFEAEETMFEHYGYPKLHEHKMKHLQFIREIKDMQSKHKRGDPTVFISLINYLADWLINHIRDMDQQYARYFAEKNIKPEIPTLVQFGE